MDPLMVCFFNWLAKDVNWNNDLTQNNLAFYVKTNFAYLKENGYIEVMSLPEYVMHINNEGQYPEAICLIPKELHINLLKTVMS